MVLAITSHIPHLVAYNIVGTVADLEAATQSEVIKFSASGFRDFTRIAASDPIMWRDVFLTNRDAVLEMLGRFLEDLSQLQRMVRVSDGPGLEALFTRTRAIRRSIITAGQETAAADFGRPHGETKTVSGPSGTVELTGAPAPQIDINVEVAHPGARAWRRRRRLGGRAGLRLRRECGAPSRPPNRVHLRAAAAEAKRMASASSAPSARRSAKAPWKTSPAASVSTALTGKAGTWRRTPALRSAK